MKTTFLIIALASLSACSTASHISDADNTWIAVRSLGTDEVYWCVNKKPGNPAINPTCYQAYIRENHSRDLDPSP